MYNAQQVEDILKKEGYEISLRKINYYTSDLKMVEVQNGKNCFTEKSIQQLKFILDLKNYTKYTLNQIKEILKKYSEEDIRELISKKINNNSLIAESKGYYSSANSINSNSLNVESNFMNFMQSSNCKGDSLIAGIENDISSNWNSETGVRNNLLLSNSVDLDLQNGNMQMTSGNNIEYLNQNEYYTPDKNINIYPNRDVDTFKSNKTIMNSPISQIKELSSIMLNMRTILNDQTPTVFLNNGDILIIFNGQPYKENVLSGIEEYIEFLNTKHSLKDSTIETKYKIKQSKFIALSNSDIIAFMDFEKYKEIYKDIVCLMDLKIKDERMM